ncbi:MAG: hypothetical protein MPK36_10765 [Gammaproteobacteria bacterium]|nr:hypothetical protein [Gammaproteobacteria bacterium]
MCERIFSWIFRKSFQEHQPGKHFIQAVGLYTAEVQSERFARGKRAALLWSVASMLYLRWGSVEEKFVTFHMWPGAFFDSIEQKEFLIFLLVATAWYSFRLFFLLAKAWCVINPFFLFGLIALYRKRSKKEEEEVKKLVAMIPKDPEQDIAGYCTWLGHLGLGPNRTHDERHGDSVDVLDDVPSRDETHHFVVRRPFFGLLENFIFPVFVFPLACLFALFSLAKAIWF